MKSDTPETDANTIHRIGQLRTAVVDVEFARKLERERDAARECFQIALTLAEQYKSERDHLTTPAQ